LINKRMKLLLACAVLLMLVTTTVATYYLFQTSTLPVTINEPLSFTYPSTLELFVGENRTFMLNVTNAVNAVFNVRFNFTLNDTTYQASYVTFSGTTYTIPANATAQPCEAWIFVNGTAPANKTLTLTVDAYRY